jgi:hypothetical protein
LLSGLVSVGGGGWGVWGAAGGGGGGGEIFRPSRLALGPTQPPVQ